MLFRSVISVHVNWIHRDKDIISFVAVCNFRTENVCHKTKIKIHHVFLKHAPRVKWRRVHASHVVPHRFSGYNGKTLEVGKTRVIERNWIRIQVLFHWKFHEEFRWFGTHKYSCFQLSIIIVNNNIRVTFHRAIRLHRFSINSP